MRVAKIDNCALAEFKDGITAVVFLCGCDLNCGFCHNPDLIPHDSETCKEMDWEKVVKKIKWKAIDWLSITGGEPLVNKAFGDLINVIAHAKDMGKKVNVDTNGYFMSDRKVERLAMLKPYIDCLSVDLKSFEPQHIYHLDSVLRDVGLMRMARFRFVVVDDGHFHDKINRLGAIALREVGIKEIQALRNSMGGRGKNFPQTTDEDINMLEGYYEYYGIKISSEKT